MNCINRTTCRLCSGKLELALALEPTPPANAFVKEPVEQECFGLDVMVCAACGHSQLKQVVDPRLLFENYVYVSGTSPSFVEHFKLYSASIEAKLYPTNYRPFAVEIGSNDATLLGALVERNFRVLGVEPAIDISEQARQKGIPTITAFFSADLAMEIADSHGQADVVIANNVFAHIDDLTAVVNGVHGLLHRDGLFVLEVQYVGDLLKGGMFDLVYHEHSSYWAFTPLHKFLQKLGMRIVDVNHVQTHGGSLRIWSTKEGSRHRPTERVDLLLGEERGARWAESWRGLGARIAVQKRELHDLLKTLKERDCSIVGYGAPAKATTFMYQMGLGRNVLDYIVDDSPLKQGLFTPGLHVPVKTPSVLYEDDGWPDYTLILAWNFADSIIEKHKALRDGGTHFIIPFPQLAITD